MYLNFNLCKHLQVFQEYQNTYNNSLELNQTNIG